MPFWFLSSVQEFWNHKWTTGKSNKQQSSAGSLRHGCLAGTDCVETVEKVRGSGLSMVSCVDGAPGEGLGLQALGARVRRESCYSRTVGRKARRSTGTFPCSSSGTHPNREGDQKCVTLMSHMGNLTTKELDGHRWWWWSKHPFFHLEVPWIPGESSL